MTMSTKSSNVTKITRLLGFIIFSGLLVITYLFASSSFQEYLEGRTRFDKSTVPFTVKDMPTLTICLEANQKFAYKRNLVFKASIPFAESVTTLKYGNNKVNGQMIRMKQLNMFPSKTISNIYPYCVSMRMEFTKELFDKGVGLHALRDEFFLFSFVKIYLSHPNKTEHKYTLRDGHIFLTSELNSYGVVLNHWYDGNVEPFELQNGKLHMLRITNLRKYKYLEGTCSKQSFYQCVAMQLDKIKICQENGVSCAPYSLPRENSSEDYPMCSKEISKDCYRKFSKVAFPECRKQKSCIASEYSLNIWTSKNQNEVDITKYEYHGFSSEVMTELLEHSNDSYLFNLIYDHLDWQRGNRGIDLKVDIYKEYLLWTVSSLIGNIGGVLGMTIGFSFFGYISILLNQIPKFWKFLKM